MEVKDQEQQGSDPGTTSNSVSNGTTTTAPEGAGRGSTRDSSNDVIQINGSVPDTTTLSGRYFVNLPDVVEKESWWKTPATEDVAEQQDSAQPSWIWAATASTIGSKFIGKARERSSGNIELEIFPSSISKEIQLNTAYTVPPLPTPSNDPPTFADYRVSIRVLDRRFADGNKEEINMTLFGELRNEDDSQRTIQIDSIPVPLKRGQVATFSLVQQPNIGRIIGLELRNLGGNQFDGEWIKVKNFAYPRGFDFFYDGGFYLTTEEGDGGRTSTLTTLPFKTFDEEPPESPESSDPQDEERNAAFALKVEEYIKNVKSNTSENEGNYKLLIQLEQELEELDKDIAILEKIQSDTNTRSKKEATAEEIKNLDGAISSSKRLYLESDTENKDKFDLINKNFIEFTNLQNAIASLSGKTGNELLDILKELELSLQLGTNFDDPVLDEDALVEKYEKAAKEKTSKLLPQNLVELVDTEEFTLALIETQTDNAASLQLVMDKIEEIENMFQDIGNFLRVKTEERSKQQIIYTAMANNLFFGTNDGGFSVSLDDFLVDDIQLPLDYFVGDAEDDIGFYRSEISSDDFQVHFPSVKVALGISSIVIPTFGVMVRERNHPGSKYFGLFVVQRSVPSEYSICTFVRKNDEEIPELTGSWDFGKIVIGTKDDFDLKITRSGHFFQGFFDNRLIGEAVCEMTDQSAKSQFDFKQRPNSALKRDFTAIKKNVLVGLVCFPIPTIKGNGTILPSPGSSTLLLADDPKISFRSDSLFSNAGSVTAVSKRAFSIVEYYNLSLFHGNYGAGRTINTLSLLPGETSTIAVKTYKDTSSEVTNTSTVFDEINDESAQELEDEIEKEQSNESQYEDSMSFHVEASAGYSNWGASVSVNTGFEKSNSSARQNMSRSLMNSLSKHATKASTKRTVEVNTNETVVSKEGEASTVTRTLRNINNSKSLTYVFRQMNQEYISVLHLVDIKVAYIGGGKGSYIEDSIGNLDDFIGQYITDKADTDKADTDKADTDKADTDKADTDKADTDKADTTTPAKIVADGIRERARWVVDYNGELHDVMKMSAIKRKEGDEETNEEVNEKRKKYSFLGFNKDKRSIVSNTNPEIEVPGFITAENRIVLRTDAVITETLLGRGVALDQYGFELQDVDISTKRAEKDLMNAKKDLLAIQKTVVVKSLEDAIDREESGVIEKSLGEAIGRDESKNSHTIFIFFCVAGIFCSSILFVSKEGGKTPDMSLIVAIMICLLNSFLFIFSYLKYGGHCHKYSNNGKFSGISDLLRSLNLLEPKYLAHKGYGPVANDE